MYISNYLVFYLFLKVWFEIAEKLEKKKPFYLTQGLVNYGVFSQ